MACLFSQNKAKVDYYVLMKIILTILGWVLTFKLYAQGIGPPAGMGTLYLILGLGTLLGLVLVFAVLKFFLKRVNNKGKFVAVVSSSFFVLVFLFAVGVTFVPAVVIENNPLETPLTIVAHKDGHYLALSDGYLYRFKNKYTGHYSFRDRDQSFEKGQVVMLENRQYEGRIYRTMYGVSQSGVYNDYQRVKRENLIVIPLFWSTINKYDKKNEGDVIRLEGDWRPDENVLKRAFENYTCCDLLWIKELINRGANDQDIVNQQSLLHRFFYYTDRVNIDKYRFKITELLLAEGLDLNRLDILGRKVLSVVIGDLPSPAKQPLTDSDRAYIRYLLDSGAEPNDRYSLLNKTIYDGHYEVLQLLIDYGADVHQRYAAEPTAYELTKSFLARERQVVSDNSAVTLASVFARMEPAQ